MTKKNIIIIIGIVLAVVGFVYFTNGGDGNIGTPSEHTWSQGSTGIVFIEYGDFQCPACLSYYPAVKEVKEKYKDLVTFQFRNYPLQSLHKNARAGSRAAEAAHIQGKFWEMHDFLYENQSAWESSNDPLKLFISYAEAIGVPDIEKFKADYKGKYVNGIINADLKLGEELGATSTPTFVLDGKRIEDNPPSSVEAISDLLDKKIEEKTGAKPVFNTP